MSTLDPLLEALGAASRSGGDVPAFRLATVTSITGGLFVRFDGEAAASTRSYLRLAAYTAAVGHRVLMARVGTTWCVLGRLV